MPNLVAEKYTFSVSKSIQNNCLRIIFAELEPNVLGPLGVHQHSILTHNRQVGLIG
jgi:hypothetical protein